MARLRYIPPMKNLVTLKQELSLYMEKDTKNPSARSNFIIESESYTSPAKYQQELQALTQYPQTINHKEEYLQGLTKSFHNSCPHRGARLKKSGDTFTCPYHGWNFDQDGKLLQSTGHRCPYPKESLRLEEIETTRIGGLDFINGRQDSSYIQEIQSFSKNAVFLENLTYEVDCNWKFLVESLLETYHFPFAHHEFLANFDNAFHSMHSSEGMNSRIVVPLQNFADKIKTNDFQGINVMYHFFPYSFILFMGVGYVWFQIESVSIGKSKINYSLFTYENGNSDNARKSLDLLTKILDQDFEILIAQQKNANSMRAQRYHLTSYEKLIQLFHQNLKTLIST